MYVLNYTKAIKESSAKLLKLRDSQKLSLYYRRLHFLYLLKSGSCHGQQEAGQQIGIKVRGAQKLFNKYRAGGLKGLLTPSVHMGRPTKLDEDAREALKAQLTSDKVQTLRQACDFIATTKGIAMTQAGMHYYFKALGIKKKTGRPCNVKKDKQAEAAFKKKVPCLTTAL